MTIGGTENDELTIGGTTERKLAFGGVEDDDGDTTERERIDW